MRDPNEFSLGNLLFALPDEVKLPISNAIGLRALANAAKASNGFNQCYAMLFAKSISKKNDKSADEYFDGLEQFSRKLTKAKKNDNKAITYKKLIYLLERLKEAYIMAKDNVIKERIGRLFNKTLAANDVYITDENLKVNLYLEGLKYSTETINALPHLLGHPTSRREVLLDTYEQLLDTITDKRNKKLIVDEINKTIQIFTLNPPPSLPDSDRLKYISSMNCARKRIEGKKNAPGCIVS